MASLLSYNRVTNVTNSERAKMEGMAAQVVDTQFTDVATHKPFTGDERDTFIYEVSENMAYGYRFAKDERVITELILVGGTALLTFIVCKIANRKKKSKES